MDAHHKYNNICNSILSFDSVSKTTRIHTYICINKRSKYMRSAMRWCESLKRFLTRLCGYLYDNDWRKSVKWLSCSVQYPQTKRWQMRSRETRTENGAEKTYKLTPPTMYISSDVRTIDALIWIIICKYTVQ